MLKIRNFFKVESNYQLFMVNVVFAITGTTSLFIADILLKNFGVDQTSFNPVLYWTFRIMLVLPVYQVLLILVAIIFGEFTYFWNIEKKMLKRFGFNFK